MFNGRAHEEIGQHDELIWVSVAAEDERVWRGAKFGGSGSSYESTRATEEEREIRDGTHSFLTTRRCSAERSRRWRRSRGGRAMRRRWIRVKEAAALIENGEEVGNQERRRVLVIYRETWRALHGRNPEEIRMRQRLLSSRARLSHGRKNKGGG